ncbi:MAG: selenium cofactor biosynthesis protein YqeC, partial [Dehalococcoidia bacterium]
MPDVPSPPPSSPAPLLWRALALPEPPDAAPVVAFVGGGGKTSLLYRLGREATARGWRVVLCGTVRFTGAPRPYAMPEVVSDDDARLPDRVREAWARGATVVVASGVDPGRPGRLVAVAPATVDAFARLDGVAGVFVEADGSRQLPLKAPGDHEPVIPVSATGVVALVGADALDAPLDEAHVHRPERVRAICDRPACDADLIARVLTSPRGGRQYAGGRAFAVVV